MCVLLRVHLPCRVRSESWPRAPAEFRGIGVEVNDCVTVVLILGFSVHK